MRAGAGSLVAALLATLPAALAGAARAQAQATPAARATGRVVVRVVAGGDGAASPIGDALVRSGRIGARTSDAGEATLALPAGPRTIAATRIGFAPDSLQLVVRAGMDTTVRLALRAQAATLSGIVVSTTRSGRTPEREPIKVEVVSPEDVAEKVSMAPGSVSMILSEAPGIRVQTTSPALGAANVRIQGLRGRYTAVLSDGLPLLGASTEGIGLLQVPPVDLDHVEVIKGAASALYGGAALGGVVNLVSRRPMTDEIDLLVNGTSRGGGDIVLWTSDSVSARWGYTLLASGHGQRTRDLGGGGWADIPGYTRGVVRPRVYWLGDRGQSLYVTTGATVEDRRGGTLAGRVLPDGSAFPVALRTRRFDVGAVGELPLAPRRQLTVRGSGTLEALAHTFGPVRERDRLRTGFVEASMTTTREEHVWVVGAALLHDGFHTPDVAGFDYAFTTPGVFAQDSWTPAFVRDSALALTASARVDRHGRYGTVASPRLSLLLRPGAHYALRLSGGSGFFAPTPFTEETEPLGLAAIRPLAGIVAERARSASADLSVRYGPFSIDGTLFGSTIAHPLGLRERPDSTGRLALVNLGTPSRARGEEVVTRFRTEDVDFFGYYVHVRATELDPDTRHRRETPLDPRHQAGLDLLFEPREGTRVGLEAFYTGRQALADDPYRAVSRPYVTYGLLLQARVGTAEIFANVENLSDVRQSRYDPLVRPQRGPGGRWTTDAWAPLEGRVVNVGVRLATRAVAR